MAGPDYTDLVAGQRAYFLSGATRPAAWQVAQLNAVKTMINQNREAMFDAYGRTCAGTGSTLT